MVLLRSAVSATADMEEARIAKVLSALAQPVRLEMVRVLTVAGQGGMTPGVMAKMLHVSPTALSFHLKELANSGLVTQERVSRHIVYRAAHSEMSTLLAFLTTHCCQIESGGAPKMSQVAEMECSRGGPPDFKPKGRKRRQAEAQRV